MSAGTMGNSDFSAWLDPRRLAAYSGGKTRPSQLPASLLASPRGPIGILAHFDISIASSAPMYNTMHDSFDLQTVLHQQFVRLLERGWPLGRATKPFRWAAGENYAQSIYLWGQLSGIYPYIGTSGTKKTIGQAVNSMNRFHVAATDMRNYIVLGDPAVRVPRSSA